MENKHPGYKMSEDPHIKYRYKMAMKHVDAAKRAGKSANEIHEIFNSIMNFDINDEKSIKTECHRKYHEAAQKAKQALAEGKSSAEVHRLFQNLVAKM